MAVYPNPVINNIINFQWGGAVAGVYRFRLLNLNGQLVLSTQIKHAANTATEHIFLNKNIGEGMYRLEIIAADNSKKIISVAVLK